MRMNVESLPGPHYSEIPARGQAVSQPPGNLYAAAANPLNVKEGCVFSLTSCHTLTRYTWGQWYPSFSVLGGLCFLDVRGIYSLPDASSASQLS